MGHPDLQVRFFLSNTHHPVTDDDPILATALPGGREEAARPAPRAGVRGIALADYFEAVRRFVARNRYGALLSAAQWRWGRRFESRDIERIHIFLEKHGAYYHPARVAASIAGLTTTIVVNVAVSAAGLGCWQRETDALNRLSAEGGARWLPRVFDRHLTTVKAKDIKLGLFMAQWLEGYHEFHLTAGKQGRERAIAVWDHPSGSRLMAPEKARQIFAQAADILTGLYNLETFEQVLAWHHAAGDFVVRTDGGRIDVKLISVRNYGPLVEAGDRDPVTVLQALLLFLINLSIRMRLDRFDGVGDIAWIGNVALEGAVLGFFRALDAKTPSPLLPDTPLKCFLYFLSTFSRDELYTECRTVLEGYTPQSPEIPVIKKHLTAHAAKLYSACREWVPPTT